MTPELTALALAVFLQLGQITLAGWSMNRDAGLDWNAGPRDDPHPGFSPLTGRLRRAVANHFEALALFTIAVVVVSLSGQVQRPYRRLRLGLPRGAGPVRPRLRLRLVTVALGDLRDCHRGHGRHAAGRAVLTGDTPSKE